MRKGLSGATGFADDKGVCQSGGVFSKAEIK